MMEEKSMKSEQAKIDLAIIGCGSFSRRFIPLFSAHPQVERVRVWDTVKERAENYAEQFGVEFIESFEAVLQSKEVNAVAIFTPRHTHGDLAVRALDAGKHVYSAVPYYRSFLIFFQYSAAACSVLFGPGV